MQLAQVIGEVVATVKDENLLGVPTRVTGEYSPGGPTSRLSGQPPPES